MKTIRAIALTMTVLAAGYAAAAPPKLHVPKAVEINAPAQKVWKAVESFDALNTWHPAVAKDEIVEGTNDTVGAVRLLTLKDGGTIKEKLLAFEPKARKFRYAILEGRAAGERLHVHLDRGVRRQGQVHGDLDGAFPPQGYERHPCRQRERQDRDGYHHGRVPGGAAEPEENDGRRLNIRCREAIRVRRHQT